MESDPTRMIKLLVGLGDVELVGINDAEDGPLEVVIRSRTDRAGVGRVAGRCALRAIGGCGTRPTTRSPAGLRHSWRQTLSQVDRVEAVGVDETLFWRQGRWRAKV